MLASFSSWVKKKSGNETEKDLARVVVVGDHYPATNERIRKRHFKNISRAVEGWCESRGKNMLIIGEDFSSGSQIKMPLDLANGPSSKLDEKIAARHKAQLSMFKQHLGYKTVSHITQLKNGTSALSIGDKIKIKGLQSAAASKFNGRTGTIKSNSNQAGRYSVKVEGEEKPYLLKRINLEKKTPYEKSEFHANIHLTKTYDLAYLGSFMILAIKFWKPVGANANKSDDAERMIKFIEHSHDITWLQLFQQLKSIAETSESWAEKIKSSNPDLFAFLQTKIKELKSLEKKARSFCSKHSEGEDERYCLTFFAAVKMLGESTLQHWCQWADKIAYISRDLYLFTAVMSALENHKDVLILVENNVALSILELIARLDYQCAHFGGNLQRLLPNHPPPSTTKFDDKYLQTVIPSGFSMSVDKEGKQNTKDIINRIGQENDVSGETKSAPGGGSGRSKGKGKGKGRKKKKGRKRG
ncbi:hypothetical protein AAMO2058_001303900 [Amorphochlora amoebiformis]|uniref:Uncharacterized protein n=1 Tax=Amorphochlora amoebiformis TaxID=1561963 RepID=A0A7S0CU32_9EUKA|mmetsp:Transcript_1267/g.1771  ORF Transcript_1267/g.1771 Transcript_1267/m.1771 type:complete len:471 (+) Transcript_1267:33-1445(+)